MPELNEWPEKKEEGSWTDPFTTGCQFGCGFVLACLLAVGILGPTVARNLGEAWQQGVERVR